MSPRAVAEWMLFATTLIWGSTFVAVKLALSDPAPLRLNAVRFTLAAVLLLPWVRPALRRSTRPLVRDAAGLALLICFGFSLQTIGLVYTTASKSAFITAMMVVFTPLLQLLLTGRPPRAAHWIGIGTVVAGLWLLTAPAGGLNRGDALTLACAAVFALYIVRLDGIAPRHDLNALAFWQIALTAGLSWIGAAGERGTLTFTPKLAGILVYLAVGATIVTTYVQTRFQRDTTPTRAALIYTLEPVWAAALAAVTVGDRLDRGGWVGAGLILAGILVSERPWAVRNG